MDVCTLSIGTVNMCYYADFPLAFKGIGLPDQTPAGREMLANSYHCAKSEQLDVSITLHKLGK